MIAGDLLAAAARRLRDTGIDQAMREARMLLAEAAGIDAGTLMAWPEREITETARAIFTAMLERRLAFEPVSRILGRREFWSLSFEISPATLDPRPDSETLIEAALTHFPDHDQPLRLLDFGTGSGCLLLALLSEYPNAAGIGIDLSATAAQAARHNARSLGFATRAAFVVGDWDSALKGSVDLIISNPPYIATDDLAGLMPDVRLYDPIGALDGGPDGLAPYRVLTRAAARLLKPGGVAIFEAGAGQSEAIASLFTAAGLKHCENISDLSGIPRAVVARQESGY